MRPNLRATSIRTSISSSSLSLGLSIFFHRRLPAFDRFYLHAGIVCVCYDEPDHLRLIFVIPVLVPLNHKFTLPTIGAVFVHSLPRFKRDLRHHSFVKDGSTRANHRDIIDFHFCSSSQTIFALPFSRASFSSTASSKKAVFEYGRLFRLSPSIFFLKTILSISSN